MSTVTANIKFGIFSFSNSVLDSKNLESHITMDISYIRHNIVRCVSLFQAPDTPTRLKIAL